MYYSILRFRSLYHNHTESMEVEEIEKIPDDIDFDEIMKEHEKNYEENGDIAIVEIYKDKEDLAFGEKPIKVFVSNEVLGK